MAIELLLQLALGAIAVVANALSAFAGGGAGLVQLPALILLGLPFASALATHKLASVALGVGAAGRHWRASSLDPHICLMILCAGLPGVWIGASSVLALPHRIATAALGLLTLSLGLYSARRPKLGQTERVVNINRQQQLIGIGVLFAIGVLNGSLSSGSGLFVTLWLVRWFGLSYPRAVAHTLIMVGLIWNGTGALVLGFSGEIHWSWLPALIVGSLIGGYLGAHLSLKQGNRLVKKAFECLALLMGLSLLIRSL
ncbi:sulfite exporter TauE/SafE family protein [Synechococcus sp. UW179A]|uniref:sulfite exporter TauE/SafE family protein n=1 Tax=Synechococcus sp. UW179A TaxID=2575510 RepID=UPI001483280D|nr:sulfite exporter TauE/SafE family protein [Synechococcus sp. UW179A]